MSLINDALRKARQEAAEQAAEEKGVSYRPPRAHLPERSKMGLGVIVGLLLGFGVAFLGAYVLLRPAAEDPGAGATVAEMSPPASPSPGHEVSGGGAEVPSAKQGPPPERGPTPTTDEVRSSETPPSRAGDSPRRASEASGSPALSADVEPAPPGTAPSPSLPSEAASPSAPDAPRSLSSSPEPSSPEIPPAGNIAAQVEAARPGAASSGPVSAVPAPPAANIGVEGSPGSSSDEAPGEEEPVQIQPPERVGQVENTNEFVLEADLGDVRLTLDFIVWVPSRPFAQINGQQVEVGQQVEGLLVEKIERERVTLRGANGGLVLRVR